MQARTQFPPEPRAAAQARHWIRDHLNEIGRADLVPSAEAGVSELVTNGILHAQTSIGLLLTGSRERVVIEVYDGSPMVQPPAVDAALHAMTDSTIGRGLRIVRAHAEEWGVSTGSHGKAVWFQPAPSGASANGAGERSRPVPATPVDDNGKQAGGEAAEGSPEDAFDLDAAIDALADAYPDLMQFGQEAGPLDRRTEEAEGHDTVEVRLLGVPPFVVHHYRRRWLEFVREMQLVALGPPSRQQDVARRFCAAVANVQSGLYVIERSTTADAPSVSDHGSAVDAVFLVPVGLREAFVDIRELARDMERSWAGTELLFVHPGRQAVQLREWWLGEFIGQIDGADPTPWPGDMRVHDEAMLSSL